MSNSSQVKEQICSLYFQNKPVLLLYYYFIYLKAAGISLSQLLKALKYFFPMSCCSVMKGREPLIASAWDRPLVPWRPDQRWRACELPHSVPFLCTFLWFHFLFLLLYFWNYFLLLFEYFGSVWIGIRLGLWDFFLFYLAYWKIFIANFEVCCSSSCQ